MRFGIILWSFFVITLPNSALALDAKDAYANSDFVLQFVSYCPYTEHQALFAGFATARDSKSQANKDIWLDNFVGYVGRCVKLERVHPVDFGHIFGVVQLLWPKQPDAVKAKIRRAFTKAGLPLDEATLEAIPLVMTAEELCPTVKLLDANSFAGPFHLTSQIFGTCYVHSTMKAMDYYNYSRGQFSVATSIGATEVSVNRSRAGNDLNAMNGGWPKDVFNHLQAKGGCQKNALDEYISDVNVFWLQQFFTDLNGSQADLLKLPVISEQELAKPLTQMSEASLRKLLDWMMQMANVSAKWDPTTINLLNELVSGERESAKRALLQGKAVSSAVGNEYVKKTIRSLLEFRERIRGGEQLLSFAAFLIEKTYCPVNKNRFDQARFRSLTPDVDVRRGKYGIMSASQVQAALQKGFAKKNPQPIVLTYFSDVLSSPNAVVMSDDSAHASLITGMKFEAGKCKVQILNSWGTNDNYDSSYSFDPTTGSLWIPVETLSPYTYQLEQVY